MPDTPDLTMLTAELRSDAPDLRAFLNTLAETLSQGLPGRVSVKHELWHPGRPANVERLAVHLGEITYRLEWKGGQLEAAMGVDPLPTTVAKLLEGITAELAYLRSNAEESRAAMERLVAGEQPEDPKS